jgi:hypothetical protein
LQHHFFNLKSVRKFLIYAAASVVILLTLTLGAAFIFKDKIIDRFVEEANKQLTTPVKIGKIDISLFSHFPSLSIELKDVYVEDSHPETFALFTAKKVSFSFNAFDAWKGDYIIQSLNAEETETNIRIDKKGVGNFRIVKESAQEGKSVSFDLKNIRLKRQRVTYVDESIKQSHEFSGSSLAANVSVSNNIYSISASGDVITTQVGIGEYIFLKDKLFNIDLSMTYDDKGKMVVFNPSSIHQEKGNFELKGSYNFKQDPEIALTLTGKNTSLQTILSLLPESWTKDIERYESEGELYFKSGLTGKLRKATFTVDFGCTNTTIFHPETNFKITQANLKGSFRSTGLSNFSTATINLKNVSGKLNGKNFTGQFSLVNFKKPLVDFQFKGSLDAAAMKALLGPDYMDEAAGVLQADVALNGEPQLLKDRKTAQRVKISGSLEMKDVLISVQGADFRNLNGNFQFTNNDLAMSDVRGKLGKTDFVLNGFFKNMVSYLLFDDQPIGIETDLKSNFMDVDELLELGFGKENSTGYQFQISPNLYLNFDCEIKRLKLKKFNARDARGTLLVKSQIARSKEIKMKTMGGTVSLSGAMTAIGTKPIELTTSAKLNSIYLDSLFYVFGNFRQNFIQDKHLKGEATANITLETKFNRDLKIIQESLVSNIDIQIKRGELNNFEPLQGLKKYLDDDGLRNLRFADLKNEIHIENKTILIPLMEVRSNVTTIQLSGRHTFDQKIDYRIVAPLRNRRQINVTEAGEAYQKDISGRMKVYFKITGTTDNYKVAYDTEAAKQKLVKNLKEEFDELKDAFNDKDRKKKKQLELEKDDYFEWDNNPL